MRTFTFSDAKSHKFWNIELKGKSFTVTFGRQGTSGQTQTKTFPDEAKAQKEYDKLIKEKLAKGYTETTPTAKPAASSAREALERALVESPDDLAAHAAYADLLVEEGDPRGEFIHVQLALEDPNQSPVQRKKLQQQEKKLLQKHAREWLGDLAPYLLDQQGLSEHHRKEYGYRYEFRRGWLWSVQAGWCNVAFTRVLARAPQARLLGRLVFLETAWMSGGYEPGEDIPQGAHYPALYPLIRSPYLGNVRILQLGEQVEDPGEFNCHMEAEGVVGLIKRMPRLEDLCLLAHEVDTDELFGLKTLNNLRFLQVYHANKYPLQKLAKNPSLGRLTHLLCHPHALEDYEEGPMIRLDGLRAVVRSEMLPSLTHLQLRLTDFGDKGATEIVKSGVLKRLKLLDLRGGCITDAGARTLAACPDLRNLEWLNLDRNCMTAAGVEALKATGVSFTAKDQWTPSGDADNDLQYLFEGDIE